MKQIRQVVRRIVAESMIYENQTFQIMAAIQQVKDKMAAAAQRVYDEWIQDKDGDSEEYGSGGICDDVSDAMADVIIRNTPYHAETIHNENFCHTACYVVDHETKVMIKADISPYHYEQGTAYNWKKIPNVKFDGSMVEIEDESHYYDQWFDENGEMLNEDKIKGGKAKKDWK